MSGNVRAPAWGGAGELVVPRQFEQVTGLGRPVWVSTPKDNVLLIPTVVALIGLVAFAIGIFVVVLGPAAAAAAPGGIGGFLAILGLWNVYRIRRGASLVVVYERGFAARVGSIVDAWLWSDIVTIVSFEKWVSGKRTAYPQRSYELSTRDGRTVVLLDDHFAEVEGLASTIKERVAPLLLPALQQAYDAGQSVTFGPVSVSREAIEAGGRCLRWSGVRDAVVKDGRLVVMPKEGSPLKVRTSRIPNVEQLGALIGIDPAKMDLMYL